MRCIDTDFMIFTTHRDALHSPTYLLVYLNLLHTYLSIYPLYIHHINIHTSRHHPFVFIFIIHAKQPKRLRILFSMNALTNETRDGVPGALPLLCITVAWLLHSHFPRGA